MNSGIDLNTPLWKLTVGEFLDLQKKTDEPVETIDFTDNKNVHGIAGIAKLLGVSNSMVHKYRDEGWIEPAITQYGRAIICNAAMALELFKKQSEKK
jgi:hypothetical protein